MFFSFQQSRMLRKRCSNLKREAQGQKFTFGAKFAAYQIRSAQFTFSCSLLSAEECFKLMELNKNTVTYQSHPQGRRQRNFLVFLLVSRSCLFLLLPIFVHQEQQSCALFCMRLSEKRTLLKGSPFVVS